MTDAVDSATNIDSQLLKRLARMREAGLSIDNISQQLEIHANTVKMLLKQLGYVLAD